MSEPMNDPSSTGVGTTGMGGASSGNATLILVLGIVGIVACCHLLGPVVWYMGKKELQGIAEGRIVAANEGTAKAGMILGIIGTVLLVVGILSFFVFGGLALLGAALEQ